jgi:HEAT repeat protein
METLLCGTAGYLWTQSLHVAALFVTVAAICWWLRGCSAHVRYLLWLLIVAKCLGPSLVTVSLAILPGQAEPAAPEAATMPMVIDVPADAQPTYFVSPPPEAIAARPPADGVVAVLARIRPGVWAAIVWLAGAAFFFAAVLIKAAGIHRRIKRLRQPAGAALENELDELLEAHAWRPKIWALPGTGQPFVWGVVRGSIYVPADFGRTTEWGRRREILAHELAHVRRCDALVNALQTAAQAVFWFHPFVWVANRAIRAEREKCCDEAVIAKLAASPRDYSSAIVDTLVREYKSTLPVPSLAIAGPVRNIEDRIKTIMRPGKRFYTRPTFVAVLVILLLAAFITPTTIALTERSPQDDRDAALKDASEEVRGDIARLQSADAGERAQAVMRLRYVGTDSKGAAAAPYLIDMLGDETPYPVMVLMLSSLSSLTQSCSKDYTFGSEAAETLARIGEKSDRLLDLLKSDNWRVRADAARAVGGLKDDRAVRRLTSSVREDEHGEVRGNAALALGLMKEKRAVRALVRALKDEDAIVRKSAASALGMIGASSAGEALAALLADSEAEVRMAAVGGLGGLPGDDVVPALLGALGDEHQQVREMAGRALARKPDERALEPLINALHDEYPNTRAAAAEALGALKNVRALDPLLEALKDDNAYVRWHAATALGDLKDGRAIEPLVMVLMKDEHIVRLRAIHALGELGGPWATAVLTELLKDGDTVIRQNAADALAKISGRGDNEAEGVRVPWWSRAPAGTEDGQQVQIDLKLFSVESKGAFLKERLGVEAVDTCLVLDDRQRQRLEDPTLLPPMVRLIAAPRVLVMDGNQAKITTKQSPDGDAEEGMPEIDVEITPHVREQGVLLEMYISMKSLEGRNEAGEPMVSAREIATSVTVGEGKSTLVELAGAGASENSPAEGEAILALVTPTVVRAEREEAPPAGPADKPFSVYGRVTDTAGAPAAGVEVRASCGMGTLMPTGRTVTDAQGWYVLYFGPGMRMSSREGHRFNTGFQAATIHAGKDGWYEVNLCQHGNLAMSDMEDPSEEPWYRNYEAVVLPKEPYKLDFVMAPAAEVRGRLVDKDGKAIAGAQLWLDGEQLYPSSSVFANITSDTEGGFIVGRVPLKKFWFSIRHENTELTTGEITFERTGCYDVELAYEKRSRGGTLRLVNLAYTPPAAVPAGMVGTWFFDNAAGDDEQMAIFPDGRIVVLYSNGHRDETYLTNGVVELPEYGGLKAKMSVAEDVVLQRFVDRATGEERIKPWTRIDAAPRTELLKPLGGAATDAASGSIMIDMRFVTTPAGFFDEGDLEGEEGIALPVEAEALFYSGPVDRLECTDLTARAELLDNMGAGLVAMAQGYKDCSVIASPRVMVRPGEPASIRIGEEVHYISGFKGEATPDGGPQPITDAVEQGMKVLVTCSGGEDGAGHVLKLVVEGTEVKGFEKRMFSGKYAHDVPRIERWRLDTGEGILVPADETLALVCPRRPQEGAADAEYVIVMIKPTTVTTVSADKEE